MIHTPLTRICSSPTRLPALCSKAPDGDRSEASDHPAPGRPELPPLQRHRTLRHQAAKPAFRTGSDQPGCADPQGDDVVGIVIHGLIVAGFNIRVIGRGKEGGQRSRHGGERRSVVRRTNVVPVRKLARRHRSGRGESMSLCAPACAPPLFVVGKLPFCLPFRGRG